MSSGVKRFYRAVLILVMGLLLPLSENRVSAQMATHDALTMATNVTTASTTLSEIVTLVEEIFNVEEIAKISAGLEKLDDVMSRFRDATLMLQLGEEYLHLVESTVDYSMEIKEWGTTMPLSGIQTELIYILQLKNEAISIYDAVTEYFKRFKTNDAEKVEAVQQAIKDIQQVQLKLDYSFGRAQALYLNARIINEVHEFFDKHNSVEAFVRAYNGYGRAEDAMKSSASFAQVLMIILFVLLILLSVIMIFRGNEVRGTLIRIFTGLVIAFLMANIYASYISSTLL